MESSQLNDLVDDNHFLQQDLYNDMAFDENFEEINAYRNNI